VRTGRRKIAAGTGASAAAMPAGPEPMQGQCLNVEEGAKQVILWLQTFKGLEFQGLSFQTEVAFKRCLFCQFIDLAS
jgi:hypothetical protein